MRRVYKAVLPLVLTPVLLIGVSGTANAVISSGCYYGGECQVDETMNTGDCEGIVQDTDSSYVYLQYADNYGTGYDCRFWMERNVNNTGWYNESGYLTLTPGHSYDSQNYWDGPGYQARVCLQFLWSGTSDPGVAHCSPAITN
ncbi:hypothetical protein ACGF3G_03465 [Streptomyces sp. NPDC048179]|uniref:hypothetical protein n=1 Tax=Streptomyces sp. NPDC048179 TaxID=3365506 RepID=UPI0037194E85